MFNYLAHHTASLLSWPVAQYIRHHRDRLTPQSTGLSDLSKANLAGHFPTTDLNRVRIVEQDPLPVLGLAFAPVTSIAAITFDHLIATRAPMPARLLFHELVHVVQYRLLGIRPFSHLYTRGFLRTGSYHLIPLEQCAYELEDRFACEATPFDVEAEIARCIHDKRF